MKEKSTKEKVIKKKSTLSQEELHLIFKYDEIKSDGDPFKSALPQTMMQEAVHELIGPSGYWIDEPLQAQGTLYKTSSGEVIADVSLKGKVRFQCVSCSTERQISIQLREDWVIVPKSHEAAQEENVQGQGSLDLTPDLYTFEGPEIHLYEMYREALILALSLHPRCEDVGQKCVSRKSLTLETAVQIDPRLAPLLAIRDQLEKDKN